MKVLFLKAVAAHKIGQVAEVAEGYAKNFLIPQKLAVPATVQAIQQARLQELTQAAAVENAEHDLDALVQALTGATIHLETKAATSGTLYASVTPSLIAGAIAKHTGHAFPATLHKQLPTLKHTGQHLVTLHIRATTLTFTLDV